MVLYQKAAISVEEGNITSFQVDALVTCINSEKMWFGGLDRVIQSVAGNSYHTYPGSMKLQDGQVIVAPGLETRNWNFKDVIFVVDDLKQQLNDLVFVAVQTAYEREYTSVSLPLMRTGVMKDVVEPIHQVPGEMLSGIVRAVDLYGSEPNGRSLAITIVVYNNAMLATKTRAKAEGLAQKG